MKRSDFVHGVTQIKVIETRLLTKETIDRMIEAEDLDQALKLLSETEYSKSFKGDLGGKNYENILSRELLRIYDLTRDVSADQTVVDLLALKYDYHNLKVMVKEKIIGKDFDYLYVSVGSLPLEELKKAYKEKDFSQIPQEFKTSIDAVEKDYEENMDPQRIDIIFDKYYFRHFYKMAKDTGIELFIKYVQNMIDFTNVSSLIRLKKQNKDLTFCEDVILENGNITKEEILECFDYELEDMIVRLEELEVPESIILGLNSYKESGRLSNFEKYKDNYLMDLNKPSKYISLGPEPIFSYIIAKEAEIKTLRIVLVGKLNNLSPELIRERVRELYV